MTINFPDTCNSESSRWSYATKLNEVLRVWHNATCAGLSAKQAEAWRNANFYDRLSATMQARNEQIEIARQGVFWNPKVPDHVSEGVIHYPSGLDQDNEGSRASFLFGLLGKLEDKPQDDVNIASIQAGILEAKKDATTGVFWNPIIEDITNG